MEHNFQSKNEKKLYTIIRMMKGYNLQKEHANLSLSKDKKDSSAYFRLKDAESELKLWDKKLRELLLETEELMSKEEFKELKIRLRSYREE